MVDDVDESDVFTGADEFLCHAETGLGIIIFPCGEVDGWDLEGGCG